jgi:hypothetical protein
MTAVRSALLLLAMMPAPALATSSIHCRTGPRGPELWLTVPNERGVGISQARIIDGGEEILVNARPRIRPWIAYSRVDPRRLSLTMVFGTGSRAVLYALAASRRGRPYVGAFSWRGRTLEARCFWDEDDE